MDELERRTGKGLNFDRTRELVLTAARAGRFLSYKQLADGSDVEWSTVRYSMNLHLGNLISYAHQRGWPLLSAIVVNQKNVASGQMEPTTRTGFVKAARELGYVVHDEGEFVDAQQRRVFAWASETFK